MNKRKEIGRRKVGHLKPVKLLYLVLHIRAKTQEGKFDF